MRAALAAEGVAEALSDPSTRELLAQCSRSSARLAAAMRDERESAILRRLAKAGLIRFEV